MVILQVLETILCQHFLPMYTWDEVEECLAWSYQRELDPAPIKRICRNFKRKAVVLRALLEALHVKATPKVFCSPSGTPHAIAPLLGQILERKSKWQAKAHCKDPGLWLMDPFNLPDGLWYFGHPKEASEEQF